MLFEIIKLAFRIVGILICVTVFEFLKAAVSTVQGDTVPKNRGWLTLNPVKFFEPIGFFLFLFYGFGWGHSAETSSVMYKDRKKGTLMTYGLPIVICFLLGVLLAKVALLINITSDMLGYVVLFINMLAVYFINIAVFNIIPLTPMAGSKLLKVFLSPNAAISFTQNEKLFQMIFMFLWFLGYVPSLLQVVVSFVYKII